MRKSTLFIIYIATNVILVFLMFAHASLSRRASEGLVREKKEMVERMGLADLCLFTEASYTRHLSQADVHTPFQDSPMSLEHFPSGSLLGPPESLRKLNGKVD